MAKPVTITPEEFARGAQQVLGKKPPTEETKLTPRPANNVAMEWWKTHWNEPRGWAKLLTRRGKGLRDLTVSVYEAHVEVGSSDVKLPLDAARKLLDVWEAGIGEFKHEGPHTVYARWQPGAFSLYVWTDKAVLHGCLASELEARRALGKLLAAMP